MKYKRIAVKKKSNIIKSSTKNRLLDELLVLRNIESKENVDKFLNPKRDDFISPYVYCDMQKAKERIFDAVQKKQNILIWGDFDCDGVTSTVILYKALTKLNANVLKFIPNRMFHGHGLNSNELLKFISKEKVKLVITVDCGISNTAEVNLLKSFGTDVIITDHHSTDTELPPAFSIINPQVKNALREDLSVYDITSLSYNSGSITAFKLALALLEDVQDTSLKDELLVIAGLGAIADVVPLLGENRAIVKEALKILNTKKENSNKGIYKLLSKNVQNRDITSYDAAFILAPRINASGRLKDAEISFEFMTNTNDTKLDVIIEQLDNYNKIRQAKCSEIYEDIKNYLNNNKDEINNPAIILLNPDWHIGVIGIAAAKVVEEYSKPCFLMTVDERNNARCSIRSNDVINVYQVLKENEDLFSGFGGHKLAGGFSFNLDEISFDKVKSSILKTIKETSSQEREEEVFYADIELNADDINSELMETINSLEPFGQDNQTPVCAMFDVEIDEIKQIGKEQNHLKLTLSKDNKKLQGIIWKHSSVDIPPKTKCDIAFYPKLNVFNEVETIQLEIVDMYSPLLKTKKAGLKIFDHRKKTGILEQIASYLKKDAPDIAIWAKNPKTKQELFEYSEIKNNYSDDIQEHSGIMFFDYPATKEEFLEILSKIKPKKIHLMNCKIDENIENYVKQLNGMLKYIHNHLSGALDIDKISCALGVNGNFVQICLEIMEDISSIKIIDADKIEYLKSFTYEEFKSNSMFEILKDEFENIIDFKKSLLVSKIDDITEFIEEKISI